MKFIKSTLFSLSLLAVFNVNAQEGIKMLPAPILSMDNFFTHHILVAEKSTHLLHLFKSNNGIPELVKSYQMTTGKRTGDKVVEGDLKTPEGIYSFVDFMTHKELMQKAGSQGVIYGHVVS